MFLIPFCGSFVTRIAKKLWADFHEILGIDRLCTLAELIKF